MRKDVVLNVSIDKGAAAILDTIARQEAENNRSLAMRQLIREAGARRGLLVAPVKQGVQNA